MLVMLLAVLSYQMTVIQFREIESMIPARPSAPRVILGSNEQFQLLSPDDSWLLSQTFCDYVFALSCWIVLAACALSLWPHQQESVACIQLRAKAVPILPLHISLVSLDVLTAVADWSAATPVTTSLIVCWIRRKSHGFYSILWRNVCYIEQVRGYGDELDD